MEPRPARRTALAAAAVLLGAGLAGCVVVPARQVAAVPPDVDGDGIADGPPPPPQYEVIPAAPAIGYVWIGGHWGWRARRHVWIGGHWAPPRPGYRWVPHAWAPYGPRWRLRGGYWGRY